MCIRTIRPHRTGARVRVNEKPRGIVWRQTVCRFQRKRQVHAAGGSDALTQLYQVPAEGDESDDVDRVSDEGPLYRRAVELIRGEFEERTWQAFPLVVLEGRPPADVAGELGVTRNTVYLARTRILRRLREEFADFIEV